MKKLILSAFAMSLCLLPLLAFGQAESVDDFLGLEMEILPDLQGPQRFTPNNYHKNKADWNADAAVVEIDKPPFKNQNYSLIPWTDIDPEKWLSVEQWMQDRKYKDANHDWKLRLRDHSQVELMGKILQCKGTCTVYRGTKPIHVTHLSRILEGDEIKTEEDSVAWVFLMDGSLMRVSPKSSVSMLEINIGVGQTLFHARLNEGHVFWNPRVREGFEFDHESETDSYSLPLMVREANLEFYERLDYQKESDAQRVSSLLEINDKGIKSQENAARLIWEKNNSVDIPTTNMMMITPNGTFFAQKAKFDLLYNVGGESHFKQRPTPGGIVQFQARGYTNTETTQVDPEKWYKVSPNGRELTVNSEPSGDLQVTELLTKRIRSIELAREIWVDKFSKPIFLARSDSGKLALDHGYIGWTHEHLLSRIDFLYEYSRRIETTHLKSIENLTTKLSLKGEEVVKGPSNILYRAPLNHYLLGLKTRYSSKRMQVREMNDLQYHVWILKNGKL
jgi:hypothetical protein